MNDDFKPVYGGACNPLLWFGHTDLFGEVSDDAVLGHLGADGEASLHLLLNARDHFLVLRRSEALHSYKKHSVVGEKFKNNIDYCPVKKRAEPRVYIQGGQEPLFLPYSQQFQPFIQF